MHDFQTEESEGFGGRLSCLPPELWEHLPDEEIMALDAAQGDEFTAWVEELVQRLNRLTRRTMQRVRARVALARARILAAVAGRVCRAVAATIARPVEAIVARRSATGARADDDSDTALALMLVEVR